MDLSIIIPVYNVENYLNECLDTIYSLNENITKEVILVNDGSTDNSLEILKNYKEKFRKETILIEKENGGLSSARNAGLEVAKGEYIIFIDSDDFINNNELEKLFYEIKINNLDIIQGNGNYIYENLEKKVISQDKEDSAIYDGLNYLKYKMKRKDLKVEVWTYIYSRKFLNSNNIKFKERLLHEDEYFTMLALSRAKKVMYINKQFYLYRQRSGSIMQNKTEKNIKHCMYIIDTLIDYANENKISNKYWNMKLISLFWGIVKQDNCYNEDVYRKLMRLSKKTLKSRTQLWILKSTIYKKKKVGKEL